MPLNYHGLADFRVGHPAVLDRLLTESVTALINEGLVSLAEIAVDGTKVRASASNVIQQASSGVVIATPGSIMPPRLPISVPP